MENASRAIIMAGGILITLIILSVLVILFSNMGSTYTTQGEILSEKQLEEYNRRFNTYERSLYGSELLSLANLISDYNYRLLDQENETGQFYEDNKIIVKVSFGQEIQGYRDEDNKWVYKPFKKIQNGDVQKFKEYNDTLEIDLANTEKKIKEEKDIDKLEILKSHYDALKSQLTEIRSLPFVCISDKTLKNEKIKKYVKDTYNVSFEETPEGISFKGNKLNVVQYNKYGRISEMHFVQLLDNDIGGAIHIP